MRKYLQKMSDEELLSNLSRKSEEFTEEAKEIMCEILQTRGHTTINIEENSEAYSKDTHDESAKLTGLGGFLILFLLYLVLSFLISVAGLITSLKTGELLSASISAVHVVWIAILVILFKDRHRSFPNVASALLIYTFLVHLVFAIVSGDIDIHLVPMLISLAWLTYLSTSRRVKLTFSAKRRADEESSALR